MHSGAMLYWLSVVTINQLLNRYEKKQAFHGYFLALCIPYIPCIPTPWECDSRGQLSCEMNDINKNKNYFFNINEIYITKYNQCRWFRSITTYLPVWLENSCSKSRSTRRRRRFWALHLRSSACMAVLWRKTYKNKNEKILRYFFCHSRKYERKRAVAFNFLVDVMTFLTN